MKTIFVILTLLMPALAGAHVGSPNVFFDGQAGPYRARVIIRPPTVLPGSAQVDVRVEAATNVTLQATLWEAGRKGAPAPVVAVPVNGEPNLFNGGLWLFYSGSYSIHVRVEGSLGSGSVLVPLNCAALQQPSMSPRLAGLLGVLGLMLFAGAVWFVAVAALDSSLEGGELAAHSARTRARWIAAASAIIFAGAIWGGQMRWKRMDQEFRANALYQPTAVSAGARTNGSLHLLEIAPALGTRSPVSWESLVADHGKLMHLFLLREPDFNVFAHLHPVRRDPQRFESILPPLPAGRYRLYGEITRENGMSETLVASLPLPEPLGRAPQLRFLSNMTNDVLCQSPIGGATNSSQPFALDADDSWHLGASNSDSPKQARESPLMGGLKMRFENAGELVENRETSLRFSVFTSDGEPTRLQPYMGMAGHCVLRRSDGAVFTHLHPVGTISMAAQQLLIARENAPVELSSAAPAQSLGNAITFPYAFPRSGEYRLWVQVRTNGRVLTGTFNVHVNVASFLHQR